MRKAKWFPHNTVKRTALLAIIVCSICMFSASSMTTAHADFGQCTPNYNCTDFTDWGGGSTGVVWCNTWYTTTTHNGWMQRCLHSKQLVLPTKDHKYAVFDMYVTSDPDSTNGVYVDWWPSRDSSVNGDQTTQETRLWRINRTSGCQASSCDQENFSPLEPGPQCTPNGGSVNIGVSATVEGVGFSVGESDPLYDGCLDVPGTDVYSQYYNWTMLNNSIYADRITTDYTFGQWAPYGYASNTIKIGLSAKAMFYIDNSGCWACDFTIGSGNWSDNYTYNS